MFSSNNAHEEKRKHTLNASQLGLESGGHQFVRMKHMYTEIFRKMRKLLEMQILSDTTRNVYALKVNKLSCVVATKRSLMKFVQLVASGEM